MRMLTLDSPVGRLVLTEDGGAIVAIEWARTEASDESRLLARAAAQLADYFDGRRRTFDLPLAPAGTDFQQRVWALMRAIPHGATRSYGALARDLETAAQAVGQACGANPIPILIPCHRVLGAKGGLGGYSGGAGLATKQILLALEGVPASISQAS